MDKVTCLEQTPNRKPEITEAQRYSSKMHLQLNDNMNMIKNTHFMDLFI